MDLEIHICNETNASPTKQGRNPDQKQVETKYGTAASLAQGKQPGPELRGGTASPGQCGRGLARVSFPLLLLRASSIQHRLPSASSFSFSIQLWVALVTTLSRVISSIIWWLPLSLFTQIHQRENLSGPAPGLVYFKARLTTDSRSWGPGCEIKQDIFCA